MTTEEIHQQFEEILTELRDIEGLPAESVVQVAQVILQESGKDRRTELLREARMNNNNGSERNPATERQKNALTRFGIEYSDDITKSEAYELLNKAFEQLDSRKKVGREVAFLINTVNPEMFINLHENVKMDDEIKVVEEEVSEIYGEDMEEYLLAFPFPISE